jgi:hypothetical protein
MSKEKELLRGKIIGIFYHPSLVLTNRRLIIGERSINLSEIVEVYSKQEKLQSKLVIRLKDGKTEELTISPERSVSVTASFSGGMDAQKSEMSASKATTDRWVNLINSCLSNIEKTVETPKIPSFYSALPKPVSESVSQHTLKNDDPVTRFWRVYPKPVSESVSQHTLKGDDIATRLWILKGLLETNLITKEDFERRKREILSEI